MAIVVPCSCGKQLRTKEEFAGKRIKCPSCGKVLTVPKPHPEPEEEPPMVEAVEEEPPVNTKSAPRKAPQVEPAGDDADDTQPAPKSKKKKRRARGGDDPYWVNPNSGDTLVALTADAIYIASLSRDDLKETEQSLDDGEQPVYEVLKGAKTIISLADIQQVDSNLHHAFIDINSKSESDWEAIDTNIHCHDRQTRDEIMAALYERLGEGWKREEVEYSRFKASLAPLGVTAVFAFVCFCMFMAAIGEDEGSGRTRVVRVRGGLQALFYACLKFLGPIPTLLLGLVFVSGGLVWLGFRLHTPPIMLTLKPRKKKK